MSNNLEKIFIGILFTGLLLGGLCIISGLKDSAGKASEEELVNDVSARLPFYYSAALKKPFRNFMPASLLNKARFASSEIERKRWVAVAKLSAMKTNAWPYVPALLKALKTTEMDLSVGYAAAIILARIEADQHPEWQNLLRTLDGSQNAARVFHFLITGNHYYLLGTGRGQEFALRRLGVEGLAATGPAIPAASGALLEIIKSSDELHELRAVAVAGMGRMQGPANDATTLLNTILLDSREWPDVSGAAALALADAAPGSQETRSLLRKALADERALVRLGAVRGLWRLGTPAQELLPTLEGLLNHKLVSVRVAALNAAVEMGAAAEPLKPVVKRLGEDENEKVRLSAASALRRMADTL